MYCTKCGFRLQEDDRYCSQCGGRTAVGEAAAVPAPTRTLSLDKRNKKVSGVCAGFARYLEVDVILVRVIWLAIALSTGVGFLAYVAAWLIMPGDREMEPRVAFNSEPQANYR